MNVVPIAVVCGVSAVRACALARLTPIATTAIATVTNKTGHRREQGMGPPE